MAAQAYIFFGEDDFSLRRKVENWKREFAKKFSAESIVHLDREGKSESDMIRGLEQALAPSLFSTRKLIIMKDFLPAKAAESDLGDFLLARLENIPKDFYLVFWQVTRPDRRLGIVKKIMTHSNASASEFELPHGKMLNAWIKAYAKTLDLTLDEPAIEELAKAVGRDLYEEKKAGGRVIERKEMFDLWQVHSEISKLASYSSNAGADAVRELVKPKIPENAFALADSISRKDKRQAILTLEQLMSQQSIDEKANAIKLIGLLAEQVRGMLLVKVLKQEGKDADEIAEALGWSSGRVYVVSKNADHQETSNLRNMIHILTETDLKLKSSEENPKLLLGQFVLEACK